MICNVQNESQDWSLHLSIASAVRKQTENIYYHFKNFFLTQILKEKVTAWQTWKTSRHKDLITCMWLKMTRTQISFRTPFLGGYI